MAVETDTTAKAGEEWDEARCKEALAHLEQMQNKLRHIRSTIPRMLQPFLTRHETPVHLFKSFEQTARREMKALSDFRAEWLGEETQKIFEQTKQSHAADPELRPVKAVPDYGWVEIVAVEKANEQEKLKNAAIHDITEQENVDVSQILEDFKTAHPNLTVHLESRTQQSQLIRVRFRAAHLDMNFVVVRRKDAKGSYRLDAECEGTMPLYPAITRCLAMRPRPNDLRYLLEMIAAYTDVRTSRCVKCGQLQSRAGISPAARRSKQIPNANRGFDSVWEALHEECLQDR